LHTPEFNCNATAKIQRLLRKVIINNTPTRRQWLMPLRRQRPGGLWFKASPGQFTRPISKKKKKKKPRKRAGRMAQV
jgi:hypothetical protein